MSLKNMGRSEENDPELSSETNSDDNSNDSNYTAHRSCNRYGSCSRTFQHASIDSAISTNRSKTTNPVKGDIRPVQNEPGHRQKFDGTKWRRICCIPHCFIYLNGGIYYDNWLCRKHYMMTIEADGSEESDNGSVRSRRRIGSAKDNSARTSVRQTNKAEHNHKRGDIMVNPDGSRQKFDGHNWRPVCTYTNCKSYIVARGYCHRHDVEMRKKNVDALPPTQNIPKPTSAVTTQIERSLPASLIFNSKPKRGEIRLIRQQWNGTKWYSLCHHPSQQCTRRSNGIKTAYLCDEHYHEYKNNHGFHDTNGEISTASTIKRRKPNADYSSFCFHESDEIAAPHSETTHDRVQPMEQSIQTDVTYPNDSPDLRHGCILIPDDGNVQHRPDSPQLLIRIKKEEEDYVSVQHKFPSNRNTLSVNCKIEIPKIELHETPLV